MNGKKKVLITGISGSEKSYLAEYLVNNWLELVVYEISRWHSTTPQKNIEQAKNNEYI